ncbi:hypothetical protein AWZ03_001699 [Drosophila navojoa]|uniref:Uncharacterized protein n=1 Tax=Drosophila navojoa TaxID=7232 RepID=A0A484BTA1_DRONA|nr:hypothetical protein AWZ03_001699 [Drosophila navojoa]
MEMATATAYLYFICMALAFPLFHSLPIRFYARAQHCAFELPLPKNNAAIYHIVLPARSFASSALAVRGNGATRLVRNMLPSVLLCIPAATATELSCLRGLRCHRQWDIDINFIIISSSSSRSSSSIDSKSLPIFGAGSAKSAEPKPEPEPCTQLIRNVC